MSQCLEEGLPYRAVTTLFHLDMPFKYKDPECRTISCMID